MGQKDMTEKLLEEYNDVFADIYNVIVFGGKKCIEPDSLEEGNTVSHYKADDKLLHEQERDVMKYWKNGDVRLAVCGIENQTKPDKQMPLRIIGYEGANYRSQYKNKDIAPVVTLVLYFGTIDRWDTTRSLKELLDIPEEMQPYVNDYHTNVVEVAWLSDEQVEMFESDFKIVARFFTRKRKDPNYKPDDVTEFKHVDAMLKFLAAMTGEDRFEKILYNPNFKKEGANMCSVVDNLVSMGREEGRAEGRAEDIQKMLKAGKTPEQIADFCGYDLQDVKNVQAAMLVTT